MSAAKRGTLSPEEIAARQAARKKRRRRRVRAFRAALLRLVLLAAVVYVLFFHIVGLTLMPSGDMYPRMDAGDLLLYYRLEKAPRAQDVIVLEKAVNSDYSALAEEEDGLDAAEVFPSEEETGAPEAAREKTEEKGGLLAWKNLPAWVRDALIWLGFRDPDAPEKTLFVGRVVAAGGDTVEVTADGRLLVNGNSMIESNIFYPTTEYVGFLEYPLKLQAGEVFVLADFRNGGADSRFFGPVKEQEILGTVITLVRRNHL